jgi:hypothetical protein
VVPVPLPKFLSIAPGANDIVFSWSTAPGFNYQVQYSTNLAPNSWTNLGGAIIASGGITSATDSRTNAERFYRLIFLP